MCTAKGQKNNCIVLIIIQFLYDPIYTLLHWHHARAQASVK